MSSELHEWNGKAVLFVHVPVCPVDRLRELQDYLRKELPDEWADVKTIVVTTGK